MTGAARVAKAAPDGYTLLLSGSAVLAINQTLYKRPLYNAVTDFEHVALFSDSARVLIARKDLPANTLPSSSPTRRPTRRKMQYGSAGAGSGIARLLRVLLDVAMGTKITHVPYRGAGPAMQDLIAGRIDFIAEQISTALPQIQGGKRQGDRHARARPRARSRRSPDRGGTRLEGPRLRRLGLVLVSQGHARSRSCSGSPRRRTTRSKRRRCASASRASA